MEYQSSEIEALKKVASDLSSTQEGGRTFFLLKNFKLPNGSVPDRMDLLFCAESVNGYPSMLFFEKQPTGCNSLLSWTGAITILGRSWVSFSWRMPESSMNLVERFLAHFTPLVP